MDRTQFMSLAEATQRALRRFLVALCCGDSHEADDLAHETLVKAYLSCHGLKDPHKFNAWIFRIAYNAFIDRRRVRPGVPIDTEALQIASDDSSDSRFRYQALYSALDRLPDRERSAVLLFYLQGYSVKEISEITSCSVGAVKQQLSRGRSHLRTLLNPNE